LLDGVAPDPGRGWIGRVFLAQRRLQNPETVRLIESNQLPGGRRYTTPTR
jgi:hypothetical protein